MTSRPCRRSIRGRSWPRSTSLRWASRSTGSRSSIGVPPRRINEIVHGKRRISADTALRSGPFFGTSERFWMNLQGRYDMEVERDRLADTLADIRPLASA